MKTTGATRASAKAGKGPESPKGPGAPKGTRATRASGSRGLKAGSGGGRGGYAEGRLSQAGGRLLGPLHLDLGGDHRDAVFVAGSGRSGTSLLAEALSRRGGYRYVFEPFHPGEVPLSRDFGYRRYIRTSEPRPELSGAAGRILSGGVRGPWTDRFNRKRVSGRRVVKDIRANLFLGWLAYNFPGMPVVLVLRHPCAVALSRERLGWRSRLEEFLEQPDLVEDFLLPALSKMYPPLEGLTGFERHVFAWCVENRVPLAQLGPGQAHLVFYENLCESPEAELQGLFRYLDYPERARGAAAGALGIPSALSRPDSAVLSGGDPVGGWRDELGEEEIRRSLSILAAFGLESVYGVSPTPDEKAACGLLGAPTEDPG